MGYSINNVPRLYGDGEVIMLETISVVDDRYYHVFNSRDDVDEFIEQLKIIRDRTFPKAAKEMRG